MAQQPMATASTQGEIEDVANIDFRTDIRLFTVMAAIRLAGFGAGRSDASDEGLPSRLHSDLAFLDQNLLQRLRVAYASRLFGDEASRHTAYTSLALLLDGPPAFGVSQNAPEIPPDVRIILGYEELLAEFYLKAGIAALWERYRPLYTEELEGYRPITQNVIRDTLKYFRAPARIALDRTIVLIPDLLGFRNVVHARNLERTYYIVVGPARNPASNYVQLQHEYLHFLIDPLVEKDGGALLKERGLLQLAEDQPRLPRDFYGRFLLIVGESLIEAILHRLHPVPDPERESVEMVRRGLILFPYFTRGLELYEGSAEGPLAHHLAALFGAISEEEVKEDLERVIQLEQRFAAEDQARREAAAAAELEQQLQARKANLLAEAGKLLARKSLDAAEAILRDLLAVDADNGNAFFYLAQIAAQRQDHAAAEDWYRQAQESPSAEDWVRAWSKVRVGRYLAYRGEVEQARRHFQSVVDVDEEFNGARKAALESLSDLDAQSGP